MRHIASINTLICKSIWFSERLTWNPAESPVCDVSRRLNVLHRTASYFSWYGIRDIAKAPISVNDGSACAIHGLVLDTFFNESPRCTTENPLSKCLVTGSPTPTHTNYDHETTIFSAPPARTTQVSQSQKTEQLAL
ncbi:hypothetical protein CSKR_110681 [Clonorchis sinensis]|uniref:Uncharacterized protein n=1 Tax=Clonorchis sinensis TaxID=79923 RepID=A0A419PXN3_CLOSI|nr:hypothetical protein CSKR_110681 [Clonorchis sinensis]